MRTGAVIVAAGLSSRHGKFKPLMKVGTITVIERLIRTLEQAGCFPIVVVTGYQAEELEKYIAKYNVICVRNEEYRTAQMFDSVKMGLKCAEDLCDQLLVTRGDVPLVKPDTLQRLISSQAMLAVPGYEGEEGHPLLMNTEVIPSVISYRGHHGLFGAIQSCGYAKKIIEVQDEGILSDVETKENFASLLKQHNGQLLSPVITLKLSKEKAFFDKQMALMLTLIEQLGSVKEACQQMNLSYSKGWAMINGAEEQLGYSIIERQHGGKKGGGSYLTDKGKVLIQRYNEMERAMQRAAEMYFQHHFQDVL